MAVACLLVLLAALRWIMMLLFSTDRTGDIPVRCSKEHGTTLIRPAAITGAITREVETYHGVDAAKGRVIGDPRDPRLVITVTAAQSADLSALHRRIQAQVLSHARQALGRPDLPIQLDLEVSGRPASRHPD